MLYYIFCAVEQARHRWHWNTKLINSETLLLFHSSSVVEQQAFASAEYATSNAEA